MKRIEGRALHDQCVKGPSRQCNYYVESRLSGLMKLTFVQELDVNIEGRR